MTTQKPIIVSAGTSQRLPDADTLLVGDGIEPSTGTALRIGASDGSTITTFPGEVRLDGGVNTLGGTTFAQDATFEGNVTFGAGAADTVTFAALTTVTSNINFGGSATYRVTNMASPSASSDAATKGYVDTQLGTVGTVTSVSGSGGTTGMTLSGGPITTIGTLTLGGTLAVANGGTGQTTYTNGQLLIGNTTGNTLTKSTLTAGSGISITNGTGSITIAATGGSGTVTSVDVSGGTTGLTTSGGPVTGSGTITLGGTLGVANGGTGTGTAFTAGSVVFAGASGVYSQDNANLFWDNTNDRLGIGSASPTTTLDVRGTVLAKNATNSATSFQVQDAAGTVLFNVDTVQDRVSIGTTGSTHTFNVGTGSTSNFAVASGGRIHTYDGSDPANGELLIGNGNASFKNFAKATLTAGSGISIVNGEGSITISASGSGGSATDLTLITTGLTVGDVCYVTSTNNTTAAANATAVSTADAIGIVVTVGGAGTGKVRTQGAYNGANFVTGLTLVAGQTAYLSKTSGKLTNDVSAYTTGNVYVPIGTILNVVTAAGGSGAADVAVNLGFSIVV